VEPDRLRSYGKVYNLGHKAVEELLNGPVVVEEKVDGSQFSFGVVEEDASRMSAYDNAEIIEDTERVLLIRSRECAIDPDAPPKMFKEGVEEVRAVADKLTPGWIYRGEYLSKPKHNTLAYDRTPVKHVAIFDIDKGQEDYLRPTEKWAEAQRLGFEFAPLLYIDDGRGLALDFLKTLLDTTSFLGGQKIEGVVIKAYGRFGLDGKTLMGKHVSEAYKEIHKGDWRERNPVGRDVISLLVNELATPARWEKAIQHLRDLGTLQEAPQDIGPLIMEVQRDVLEEEGDYIMEKLMKWAWRDIARKITAGLPTYYKEKLLVKQFLTQYENAPSDTKEAFAALASPVEAKDRVDGAAAFRKE
jgi:RNA ligase-like protein